MSSPSTCIPQVAMSMRRPPSHNRSNLLHVDSSDDEDVQLSNYSSRRSSSQGSTRGENLVQVPLIMVTDHVSVFTPFAVEALRRKLRFFFMNPIEKWHATRQVPWKLVVQVIKIIFVTLQLSLFGSARYSHINFYEDNKITLCHLFLKNWDSVLDVEAYPPNQGPYAVYTKSEFYAHIDHIIDTYSKVREIAIGSYDYAHANISRAPVTICKKYYKKAIIWGFNETFVFDSEPVSRCLDIIPLIPINSSMPEIFDSKQYFKDNNFSVVFDRLIHVEVKFSLKYVLLRALSPMDSPDCYRFDVEVMFDDQDHDGQLRVFLEMTPYLLDCSGRGPYGDNNLIERRLLSVLNVIVILICVVSFLLCIRAIIRAQFLKQEAIHYFRQQFHKTLTFSDKLEFLNFWYVMIIINDVLIIIGSTIKIQIENKVTEGDLYNVCSVLLATGNLLVWLGVLRYLGFFRKYNILILTMRKAAPDVLRFLLCAILMYSGFVFCGWLILGPYHLKFRSLSSTSECLFALINGDDMYATFSILDTQSGLVWWYSRLYMYSFITLFIYVVLSLFIAVIMDTYETIKMYYLHGLPKSDLMEFVSECQDDINSGVFQRDRQNTFAQLLQCISKCFKRKPSGETEPLLHRKC